MEGYDNYPIGGKKLKKRSKNNFLKLFLERHTDLKIIKQKKIKYLENESVDEMFLLEKIK